MKTVLIIVFQFFICVSAIGTENSCKEVVNRIKTSQQIMAAGIQTLGMKIVDPNNTGVWLYGVPKGVFAAPIHSDSIDLGVTFRGTNQKIYIDCETKIVYLYEQGGIVDTSTWYGPFTLDQFRQLIISNSEKNLNN